jgi:hypothetical protein
MGLALRWSRQTRSIAVKHRDKLAYIRLFSGGSIGTRDIADMADSND